ncbi:DUF4270 domain-containing protein [Galbibacter mesophilus]|uniref:DUF4270 domain-containing protein n=1 Tax=Galbibacter mesophilus TaxID=379069 RepID=UPI00191CFC49|nr:DUF4270 domain-containing protein [Galbibacter mesophilus]MCM5661899.1 DUF4270 domain-containing protein [Galbibacter mesophilus]
MKRSFKGGKVLTTLLVLSSVIFFIACEKDYNTVGVDLVDNGQITTNNKSFDVSAFNRKLQSVRTNGLPGYQLGDLNHAIYGVSTTSFASQLQLATTNPSFGDKSQSEENSEGSENERITAVYLNIPFFSTELADTTDLDEDEPKPFRVDSIFGNREAAFNLKVQEFTKFLRDLDPDSNFQEAQEYFSNEDPLPFATTVLYENTYKLSFEEIVISDPEAEDDPDTDDVDESKVPKERIRPGIRVELNKDFFQQKILDNEGQSVLTSQNNFKDFLRGLYISADMPNEDLAMLLNANGGNVEIEYDYDAVVDEKDTIKSKSFKLNLTGGNKVNYIENAAYPMDITNEFNNANASKLYPYGGAGSYVEIDVLAGTGNTEIAFQEAIEKGWLINEANLVFYVDESSLPEQTDLTLPQRLYLYDLNNNRALIDYNLDLAGGTGVDSTTFNNYGGRLDKNNDSGLQYKFRVTDYINNIIRNDSTNTRLGLSTSSNIFNSVNVSAFQNAEEVTVPQASITNMYGTVLKGNNVPDNDEKRLKLEIYYTEPSATGNN